MSDFLNAAMVGLIGYGVTKYISDKTNTQFMFNFSLFALSTFIGLFLLNYNKK